MIDVCPSCWTSRSADGSCSCDIDGVPPAQWRAANPAMLGRLDRSRSKTLARLATSTDLRPVVAAIRDLVTCQAPGPNGRTSCDACLDRLGVILRAVPAVAMEVNFERDGVRGIDYRTLGGGTGGKKSLPLPAHVGGAELVDLDAVVRRHDADDRAARHHAPPLVVTGGAIAARDRLRTTLWQAVVGCLEARTSHTSPRSDVPHRGDIPAMADWLTWRIDAMPDHRLTEGAPREIALAVDHALHVVDRPATRERLGPCLHVAICGGELLAAEGSPIARCDSCGFEADAVDLRGQRLDALWEQRLTASEIAQLVTHLGGQTITAPRDVVRRRVNHWAHRETLPTAVTLVRGRGPVYRFADAYALLVAHEARHVHSWSPWRQAPPEQQTHLPDAVVHVRHCEFEDCAATKTRRRPAPRGRATRRSA